MTVCEFFEDAEVFITGGSGVVGKAVVEKLLRSCNVKCIYLLLRTRKQLSAEQRLQKICEDSIFEVLREQKPNELRKLVAIPGDVALPHLGIEPENMKRMAQVSIVFHCAATVRFDEPIRVALQLNVGGTFEALKFAETLLHLRVFVHVSTFFSNPYLDTVESKYYSSPMEWRKCLQLAQTIKDDDMLNALTRKLIVGFPNTYTFTKNLAESLINDYRTRLPVIVYRPSIVLFSIREPVPGYAPSLTGAMGLFTLVGSGLLKTVYLGENIHLDLTPQDVGIKALLYFTQQGNETYKKGIPDELLVYQVSSCTLIPFTFQQIAEEMDRQDVWYGAAFEKQLLLPGCIYTDNSWLYHFLVLTKQILPALFVDMLLILSGRKPAVMGIVRKLYLTLKVMQPFMFNNYSSSGITGLKQLLDDTRGTICDLDDEYLLTVTNERIIAACKDMLHSIRRHRLKEDPSTLRRSQRIMQIKVVIYNVVRLLLLYKLLSWLWRIIFPN
ncbi:fatty acyl-CoA reductase wat [Scaptodrosophila lebanonensis]|uniref:Fatty acyl-CoA reductase n=1 Tax=Drosophila lebanonensis TaxID=7225 RepID=A0A6J2TZ83_DROLE|nr:fatty acyl-CoA reductase wat [Scaptodrosophila lebanonensis]